MPTPADVPFAPYGGRRFALAVGSGLVYTVLLVAGLITEDAYIWLQGISIGAFMAANSAEKLAENRPYARRNDQT